MNFLEGIDSTLSENLEDKIVHHRERFYKIFMGRYLEMLPSLIQYKNGELLDVDFLKVEVALRAGYDVVIGETVNHDLQVLGYSKSSQTTTNPRDLFSQRTLKTSDIQFTIPKHLRLPFYNEITDYNAGEAKGNFVVLRNKTLNYPNDHDIINHYVL